MSKNSEVLLAGYEAWNQGDLDGWLQSMHPDVELRTSGVFPGLDPVYRGHERVAEFWRQLREPWETFRIDIEQIEEESDRFVVAIRFRGKGIGSGVEVDMRFGQALWLVDGLVTGLISRRTAEETRAALREWQPAGPRQRT